MMLFYEFIEQLTYVPLILIAILATFWKADEAISRGFRRDISKYLCSLDFHPPSISPRKVVLSQFDRVFDKHPLTSRFIFRSILVSIGCFAIIMIPIITTNWRIIAIMVGDWGAMEIDELGRSIFMFYTDFMIFSVWIPTNICADYVSLCETRFLIKSKSLVEIPLIILLLIDVVFTITIFWCFAALWIQYHEYVVMGGRVRLEGGVVSLFAGMTSREGPIWFYGLSLDPVDAIAVSALITTFLTSTWLWAAASGTFLIQALSISSRTFRVAKYVLPIDEKPLRSIGVAGSIITLVVVALIELCLLAI